MSDAVDTRVRELVKASSIETREAIFEDLLRELIQIYPTEQAVPLQFASGELLGHFVRPIVTPGPTDVEAERNREHIRKTLGLTPEDEAEYARREATPDDVLEVEEVIRRLREAAPLGTR